MSADRRDELILQHAPLHAVPRYGGFEPLQGSGHRFLAAHNGLWLEVKRPWLHFTAHIAETGIAMPYGAMPERNVDFSFGEVELAMLIDKFVGDAKRALPNECAAWGVWDDEAKRLEYRPCIAIDAGPGGVTFHRPALQSHEHLAVDIHSHGALAAFFSGTDDQDDLGEVKLSVVVGRLDKREAQVTMRLCAMGLFVLFGGRCRECGCTNEEPCEGGCHWVEPDLCSACAEAA